ncbi:hypothetical protein TCAP_07574, partial [Tolypocladium capitatum]
HTTPCEDPVVAGLAEYEYSYEVLRATSKPQQLGREASVGGADLDCSLPHPSSPFPGPIINVFASHIFHTAALISNSTAPNIVDFQ